MSSALRNAAVQPGPEPVQRAASTRWAPLLASALYQAGRATGQHEVTAAARVVAAYSDTDAAATPGLCAARRSGTSRDQTQFTLAVAAGAIVTHITDLELKEAVCNQFMDHLQIPATQLAHRRQPLPGQRRRRHHLPSCLPS